MQRTHKLKSDFGMPDYHKFYEKNYKEIDKILYNKLITEFNREIVKLMLEKHIDFKFPYLNLILQIRKSKRKPRLEDGELVNPVPIDWKKTNKLWENNPEAKQKKLLVRYNNSHSSGYVYRIIIKKFNSKLKNKKLLKIEPNRTFKRSLSKKIKNPDDSFDSYLLY